MRRLPRCSDALFQGDSHMCQHDGVPTQHEAPTSEASRSKVSWAPLRAASAAAACSNAAAASERAASAAVSDSSCCLSACRNKPKHVGSLSLAPAKTEIQEPWRHGSKPRPPVRETCCAG